MTMPKPHIAKAEPREMAGNIPVFCSFDEITPLESIIPNPKNPNTHPEEQIQLLSNIISSQGWRMPIVVSTRSGFIVKGHGRLEAAKAAGMESAPVEYQNYGTEAEEYADLIADNRIAELSIIDEEMLKELLAEMEEEYQELTGYSEDELTDLLNELESETASYTETDADDFEVEPPAIPTAKRGDIYQLGRHRLMCGDSTDPDDVYTLMDGETCSLLITDPPYNVNYEGGTDEKLTIQNDNMDDKSFRLFLASAFKCADNVMKPGAAFYLWHSDSEGYNFRGACRDNDWKVRQCLIWRKNSLVLGRQDYHWQHEPCLYGWKDGAAHLWNSDRSQTTILDFDKPSRNGEHPTMKPVDLFSYQIQNNTKKNDYVLDLFGGSGTTLVACEQLDRVSFTMELDPRYVDVIVRRYEELTGQKAVLLNAVAADSADEEAEEVRKIPHKTAVQNN